MNPLPASRLFIIAILCGLVAAGLTIFYMQQVENKYRKAAQPKKDVMVGVVVPRENMSRGDRITQAAMASRNVPEKFLPANAVMAEDFKKVVNRTLLVPLQKGRPMTWDAVTGTAAKTFSEVVELGRRARTVKVNSVDSFDGLLRPGDMIDLMGTFELKQLGISYNADDAMSDDVVMPVLEQVEVLAASREDLSGRRYELKRSKNSADGFNMDFTLITLNLTSRQIARLEMAEQTGDFFAVLRNPKDTSLAEFDYLGVELLLEKDVAEPIDLVLDENGQALGRIIGDNVVDKDGNIIGKVVDGKAVTFDGKPMGKIVKNVSADDPIHRVAEVADVVRDAEGNIIGKIVDGKIVDKAGNIIGEVKDGQAIGLNGASLGSIERDVSLDKDGNVVDTSTSSVAAATTRRETVVRDAEGNVIGKVVNGKVVDANGRVIGNVDARGNAVGLDGRTLGKIEEVLVDRNGKVIAGQAQVVRDKDGKVIGRVVDGKVVDASGKVIGIVDEQGNVKALGEAIGNVTKAQVVRDADGNIVGTVVDGKIVDQEGNIIGEVGDDGIARSLDGKQLGAIEQSEVVRDAEGSIIGTVVDGKVVDAAGKVVGVVGDNGEVLAVGEDTLGVVETAMVDASGNVVSTMTEVVRDAEGNVIGRVVNGEIVDAEGQVIGKVNADGKAVDLSGNTLGTVETVMLDQDGRPVDQSVEVVRDAQGNIIGTIVDGKVVDKDGKIVGEVINGQVVDANGNVIASDIAVSSESALAVAAETRNAESSRITSSIRVIDFIPGGQSKDGITPINKVRVE